MKNITIKKETTILFTNGTQTICLLNKSCLVYIVYANILFIPKAPKNSLLKKERKGYFKGIKQHFCKHLRRILTSRSLLKAAIHFTRVNTLISPETTLVILTILKLIQLYIAWNDLNDSKRIGSILSIFVDFLRLFF